MNTFVTHPSIRIKGTENNYEPVLCTDTNCSNRNPHMHCPFCVKTEVFLDPVILKAHYRVKHVDKGIDFAGLKVLRCCDHCDIVGTIKGMKEFKGAHWHCYRCRNGFNRRDEAIKHFRTHFRNPQTTFQIQISEEVNQMFNLTSETDEATEVIADLGNFVHPVSDMVVSDVHQTTTAAGDNGLCGGQPYGSPPPDSGNTIIIATGGKQHHDMQHVAVAANETVGTTAEGPQTIMIIQEEDLEDLDDSVAPSDGQVCLEAHITTAGPTAGHMTSMEMTTATCKEVFADGWLQERAMLEQRIAKLQQQNEQLLASKTRMEQQLRAEVDQLKLQVRLNVEELADYDKREQELLGQLSVPLDSCVEQIINKMKVDHEDLLHHQMALLRRTYPQVMTRHQGGTYNVTLSPVTDSGGGSVHTVSGDTQATPMFIVTRTDSDCSLLSTAPKGSSVTCEDSVIVSAAVSLPHNAVGQMLSVDGVSVTERTGDMSVTTLAADGDVAIMVSSATDASCKREMQQNANCIMLHPQMVSSVLPSGKYTQLLENNCDKKRGHVDDPTSNGPTPDTKRHRDDASL